jgi:hypothetical protein
LVIAAGNSRGFSLVSFVSGIERRPTMRRAPAGFALATALLSIAAAGAGAASSAGRARTLKSHALGCEVMRSGFIDVRNTTGRTIAKGTRIELTITVAAGNRTFGVRRRVTALQSFESGLYHAFAPVPRGAKSCSATVAVLPDYLRR